MRIRTANRRRARVHAREVYRQAFEYHQARCQRLEASGNLQRLMDSGFIRRWRRSSRGRSWGTPDVIVPPKPVERHAPSDQSFYMHSVITGRGTP